MKRAILGLALAALLPVSAQAADESNNASGVSYNYIEAQYINADIFGEDVDGFALAGSFGFGNNFYGSANYRQIDEDGASLDLTDVNLGWHHALSDQADFLAEIGYARLGADVDGFGSDSADGYRAAVGFRGKLASNFEGQIKASWTKIDDLGSDGEFGAAVQATYHFTPTWGVTGSYEHMSILDEDVNVWGLGIRASF